MWKSAGLLILGMPALAQTASPDIASAAQMKGLHLRDAERIALRDNHDISLARLGVEATAAAHEIAAAAPNPTVTVQTLGINPRLGIGSGDLRSKTVDSAIRVDQLFERGDKRALREQNASFQLDASRLDSADAARQLRVAVRQAYYDLMAVRDKARLIEQTVELYGSTVDAARKRQRAGDLAPSDVARLQVDALRARNDATMAQAEVTRVQHLLASLMGHNALADNIVPGDDWPQLVTAPKIDVDAIVAARADVRAAAARVKAAERGYRLALAARTRDVSIGLQADHYPTSAMNQQGSGNSFSISIQIPLFLRYEFDGEIRSAAVALASAKETRLKVVDAANTEVFLTLHERQVAAERLARYESELMPAAIQSAAAAEFAFEHGAISIMDVLDVRRTLRQTQLDALDARVSFAKSSTVPLGPENEDSLQ